MIRKTVTTVSQCAVSSCREDMTVEAARQLWNDIVNEGLLRRADEYTWTNRPVDARNHAGIGTWITFTPYN